MASEYENNYASLVANILYFGGNRQGRNGATKGLFAKTLTIKDTHNDFPLLLGRKLYPEAVLGEFAAFIRQPNHIHDFQRFGCNYWRNWAKPDGAINVDYGNAWYNYNGIDQVKQVVDSLKQDPHGRRHIITGWRPDKLSTLDLPCCHMLYQWYVRGNYLDMIWYQRSADLMIGVPADVILAAIFNICMAKEVGLVPGEITFIFGDVHIYEEHFENAETYLNRVRGMPAGAHRIRWRWGNDTEHFDCLLTGPAHLRFKPSDLVLENYEPLGPLKFEVKI